MPFSVFVIFLFTLLLYRYTPAYIAFIPLILMLVNIIKYAPQKGSKYSFLKVYQSSRLLILLTIIYFIAMVRSNQINHDFLYVSYIVITISLFFINFSFCSFRFLQRKKYAANPELFIIEFILTPFALYAIVNFLFYFMHARLVASNFSQGYSGPPALFFALLGVNIERVEFPLVSGYNYYSIFIAGAFIISFFLFLATKKYRIRTGVFSIIFLAGLLCVDSRASILYSFLITGFLLLVHKRKSLNRNYRLLSLIVIIGPIFFLTVLPLLAQIPGMEFLSRNDEDLETGNSRVLIWLITIAHFSSFKMIHLIGYGEYGHLAGSTSKLWAYLFESYKNADQATAHSTLFSSLYDIGYIGVFVYIAVLWQSINRLRLVWQHNSIVASILLGVLTYTILSGITESLVGFNNIEFTFLFYMVVIIINILHSLYKAQLANKYHIKSVGNSMDHGETNEGMSINSRLVLR